jgi:hypothetical protein
MRFRKLRIAGSIVCGIACALLIALWVRSYWRCDSLTRIGSNRIYTQLFSDCGTLCLSRDDKEFWRDLYVQRVLEKDRWLYGVRAASNHLPMFGWRLLPGEIFVRLPYWLVLLGCTFIAPVPWLRPRFTLRTLLIATTLVAVVLGLIVWLQAT